MEDGNTLPGTMSTFAPREIDSILAPCPVLVNPSLFMSAKAMVTFLEYGY
jgi:hypothetical protein